jgi:hypothetical protein
MRARRKERGFSQVELAWRASVSLGSLKHFERTYEGAFASLIRLVLALGCEEDFEQHRLQHLRHRCRPCREMEAIDEPVIAVMAMTGGVEAMLGTRRWTLPRSCRY